MNLKLIYNGEEHDIKCMPNPESYKIGEDCLLWEYIGLGKLTNELEPEVRDAYSKHHTFRNSLGQILWLQFEEESDLKEGVKYELDLSDDSGGS